jgi:hypothetical protein
MGSCSSHRGQCFEMIADRFERPTLDQLAGLGFEAVPEVANEIEETAAAGLLPAQLPKVTLDLFLLLSEHRRRSGRR